MIELNIGSETLSVPSPVTGSELLSRLNPKPSGVLAMRVGGEVRDLSALIESSASIDWIASDSKEGLDILRHSTAHLLAHAVSELYPQAQITIGPVVADGFFYDIDFGDTIGEEALPLIETRMQEIVARKEPVTRKMLSREEAVAFFQSLGQRYKVEIIRDLPEEVREVSLYSQGGFTDLCRGVHVPSTGVLGAFKLLRLAGAYWRGDSKNPMLQRIYGTAFATKDALKTHLEQIEEAKKRDHRLLGTRLGVFHTQEEAPGMPFWGPQGMKIYRAVEAYMRSQLKAAGYEEIRTPILMDESLWRRSGHWDKFGQNMFFSELENRTYAVKPMSCPGAIAVFSQNPKSYRDLPIRFGEFGLVHRFEPSGTLYGLMRVRAFTQDDAHVFCTPEQLESEIKGCVDMITRTYKDFGFEKIEIRLSTRPEQRIGSDEVWDLAEGVLHRVLKELSLPYEISEGEGAFYGPKYEFTLFDALGRGWQCGTVQVDFSMAERLGAHYTDDQDQKRAPVLVHRAILGSMERFVGILIEHYKGELPLWLAPRHVRVLPVTDEVHAYAQEVADALKETGAFVEVDLSAERLGRKIREAAQDKIPFQLVVGKKEAEGRQVSIRNLQGEERQGVSLSAFGEELRAAIRSPLDRRL